MIVQLNPVFSGSFCGADDFRYDVKMDRKMTLEEFCLDVAKCYPDEWGYISIGNSKNRFRLQEIEYSKGEVIDHIDDAYSKKYVKYAYCIGAWTKMDYYLYLED